MRLLMVSHSILPWTPLYAGWFARRGDAVRVVSFSPGAVPGVETDFVGVEPFDKYRNKHLFLTRVPRVRRIVRDFRPDVVFATYVISNGLTALLAGGGPLAVSAQGGDVRALYRTGDWRNAVRRLLLRRICRRAGLIHSVSRQLSDMLVALGAAREKIHEAPSGVDTRLFAPDPAMPRLGATRIICIRKHEPVYDLATLVDALATLHRDGVSFHCTFVGGGHLLEAHRARAAEAGLGGKVEFRGAVPHGELPSLLRSADLYVSPSLSDGTSASLLEALASGLFPVVTRIEANTPWIADGRTGLLFEPRRADQLAAALKQALGDADLRRGAFVANRERVLRNGDFETNMAALAKRIDALASGARR